MGALQFVKKQADVITPSSVSCGSSLRAHRCLRVPGHCSSGQLAGQGRGLQGVPDQPLQHAVSGVVAQLRLRCGGQPRSEQARGRSRTGRWPRSRRTASRGIAAPRRRRGVAAERLAALVATMGGAGGGETGGGGGELDGGGARRDGHRERQRPTDSGVSYVCCAIKGLEALAAYTIDHYSPPGCMRTIEKSPQPKVQCTSEGNRTTLRTAHIFDPAPFLSDPSPSPPSRSARTHRSHSSARPTALALARERTLRAGSTSTSTTSAAPPSPSADPSA